MSFPIFNVVNIQKIRISWKISQNLAGKPTEREELPFLYKNLDNLIFKIFAGGPKLRNTNSKTFWKILFVEFQGGGSIKCLIFSV